MAKPKFTLREFAKFLASNPPHRRYDYFDCETCPAAKFSALCGRPYTVAMHNDTGPFSRLNAAQKIEAVAGGGVFGLSHTYTYGAAHKRALEMLPA